MNSLPLTLQNLIKDPSVTDLCLNGPFELFVDRGEGMEAIDLSRAPGWGERELWAFCLEALSHAGKSWDSRAPFVDGVLKSGHRFHFLLPPLSPKGVLVSLRRLRQANRSRSLQWKQDPLFETLSQALQRGETCLISGATGSGKTTLASELISTLPARTRILALEDTPELEPDHPHFLTLQSRPSNADGFGAVSLRELLRQALRMRPDRIVLGECRGAEVLDLLQALNSGHAGSLATLHANSPREALQRIELLCAISSQGAIPPSSLSELLVRGVGYIAQLKRDERGKRKIDALCKVAGKEGDLVLLRPIAP
jgi:pilus assembly protein CpaF